MKVLQEQELNFCHLSELPHFTNRIRGGKNLCYSKLDASIYSLTKH